MDENKLKQVLIDQATSFRAGEIGTKRAMLEDMEQDLELEHILDITGIRRVGKTTLLRQIADGYYQDSDYYHINFDDDRLLGIEAEDFQSIYEVLLDEFGQRDVFLLDEIQNVQGWERFVRRFMDRGFKLILTGSNSQLLNRELGTKLTGRHLSRELYPFSFEEFLRFHQRDLPDRPESLSTENKSRFRNWFEEFLQYGGMPLYWKYENSELLRGVYEDVIFRDIVARHGVSKVEALKKFSYFLISNISGLFSPSKIPEEFGIQSHDTMREYLRYLSEAWLLFTVPVYDDSLKRQQVNPKKIYCVDNGIVESTAFQFVETRGSYLENAVFIELKRRGFQLYYYKTDEDHEVDFLARKNNRHRYLIQVCYDLSSEKTKEREIKALREATREIEVEECLLLTMKKKEVYREDDVNITIQPAWEWFLERK